MQMALRRSGVISKVLLILRIAIFATVLAVFLFSEDAVLGTSIWIAYFLFSILLVLCIGFEEKDISLVLGVATPATILFLFHHWTGISDFFIYYFFPLIAIIALILIVVECGANPLATMPIGILSTINVLLYYSNMSIQ